METVSDRIQWILEHRGFSARGLSLKAGKSQSYVGQLLRGDIKGGMKAESAKALARAAGVDWNWLLTGEGKPEPGAADDAVESVVRDPRYENLEAVIRYRLRERPGRWSEETLDLVRGMKLAADEDPSNEEWERRLNAFESTMRRLDAGESFGTLVDEEETRPPRGRGKNRG